jgi:radical SAM superfamily enzyme YgiQ (UPF0313 family)
MKIGFIRLDDRQLYDNRPVTILEPLGLEYLISSIKNEHETVLWDLNLGDKLENYENCDYICLTVPTPLYNQAKHITKLIHDTSSAKVIVGGPHPSISPQECLDDLGADYAVKGEGELVLGDILQNYMDTGIYEGNPVNIDVNALKYPSRTNKGRYRLDLSPDEHQTVASVITSRSCPYPCTFCSSKKIFGNRLRLRSVDNIISELTELKTAGYDTLIFLDDAFTFDRQRTIEICKKMVGMGFRWWIDTRVDKVDEELLEYMKAAGCAFIVYGIESGNEEILKRIKKGIHLDSIRNAVKITKAAGIRCKANLMLGHHDETIDQMADTISLALELQATKTSFYQVIPLPGTELFQYIKITDTSEYDRFKWYGDNIPTICDKSINSDKLKAIQELAYTLIKKKGIA